ncbi:MAG TPA: Ig-like domain repeat protein [Solirubrobacterales bacterium]|nr:Ig-like domain repeat protein [Solirubrobacterales bacterium]
MKLRPTGPQVAALVTVLLFACGFVTAASAGAAVLSGTVSGQTPGGEVKPLPETNVTVTVPAKEELVGTTTVDAKGAYSLEVPDGVFDVRFNPPGGFEPTTVHAVEVKGSRTLSVILSNTSLVHLTGTLRDAAGNPVPGASISANSSLGNGTTANGITGEGGSYDLAVPPGNYELSANGGNKANPSLPPGWYFQVPAIELEADRTLDLELPPTVQLTIEALDSKGGPIAEAFVGLPTLSRPADLGGASADYLQTRGGLTGHTGADGRVSFTVFGGQAVNNTEVGEIVPPNPSGYGRLAFEVPFVEGDTTLSFQFTGGGEEEPVEDVEGPHLNEFGIEPGPIDTSKSPQTVIAYANISDDLSGFAKGAINFRAPNGERFLTTFDFERVSGNANAGDYRIRATFPQFSEPGTYAVEVIYLYDAPFNETAIKEADLKELGWQHTVTVAGEGADTDGPTLTELSIEPDAIDTSSATELVTVRAHVEDNLSGFSHGTVTFISPSGSQSTSGAEFERIAGTANSGDYLLSVPFEESSETGPWTISEIRLVDAALNSTILDAGQVVEMGFPNTVVVEDHAPPVAIASSPNPSVRGQKVTFTAKVLPPLGGGPTPLGTVAFVEGSNTLAVVNLSKGTATFNTTTLGAGKHPVFARYSGDSYYGPGESEAVIQVVDKAETEVTVSSPFEPAPFGASGSLKATVKAVAPGTGTPAGTVTFRDGETVLATVQMSGSSASLPLKSLPVGPHAITASYGGDPNYLASASAPLTQTIVPAQTTLDLTSTLNPAPYGSAGTLKATVDAAAPSLATPTGVVTFWDGEEALASVPLSAGVARFPLKALTPGSYPIHATYEGGSGFEGSSGDLTQVVTKAETTLDLTSTLNPAPYGSSGTLKAVVKAVSPGGGTPSGTVTFREGETVLAVVPLSGSTAKYAFKSLEPGVHQITASYSGDPGYEPSGAGLEQAVTKAATAVTVTSGKNPAPSGSSASIKATVKAQAPGGGAPTGTVTFLEGKAVLATVPLSSGSASYPLKSLAPGTHEVVARYNGSSDYEPAEGSIVQVIGP